MVGAGQNTFRKTPSLSERNVKGWKEGKRDTTKSAETGEFSSFLIEFVIYLRISGVQKLQNDKTYSG